MKNNLNKSLADFEQTEKKEKFQTRIFIIILLAIVALTVFFRTTVLMTVSVSGRSMCNTLTDGDLLFANRIASIERGDIVVVFDDDIEELQSKIIIKRVIGLAGDELWSEDGYIYRTTINSHGEKITEKLQEDYLFRQGVTNLGEKIVVPQGYIFILGDNRDMSLDSRRFGCVREDAVLGVVFDWSIAIKDGAIITWYKKLINA